MSEEGEEEEEYCPCGGPPCQTPSGYGCGRAPKSYWENQRDENSKTERTMSNNLQNYGDDGAGVPEGADRDG
jgi:hypothetical protein